MDLKRIAQILKGLFLRVSKNILFRLLVNLLVFGFCGVYLFTHLQSIIDTLRQVQFHIGWLLLAFLITGVVDWMGGVSWWLLLLGVNQDVTWFESWQAQFKSALAKYVPGFVWHFLGKGYLTSQMGVSTRVISILMVWEFILMVMTGLGIGLVFMPPMIARELGLQEYMRWLVVAAGAALLLILQIALFAVPRWFYGSLLAGIMINKAKLLSASFVVLAGWMLHGVALWFTMLAFGIKEVYSYPFFVFTFAISLVAGILALPVPNGLGVREGIIIFLVGHFVPLPTSILVATISRLEIVTGEVLCQLIIEILHQFRVRKRLKKAYPRNYY